jgi:hypothetical protein
MDIGLHTTLLDTNSIADPEVIALAERISPLQAKEFGRVWDLFTTRATPFETDEYEILTRNYTAPQVRLGTIAGSDSWDDAADLTGLEINSADISVITVGDILLTAKGEVVVVKSVDRTGNTIDVYERGASDSSALATHATGDVAKIIGNAHIEGTANAEAMAEQTSKLTNYCQIVEEVVDLSKENSDQARKVGMTADVLKAEAMERVMRDLARSAIYGYARAGTASIPAMTRGLISHLNDVSGAIKTAVSGAFTETALKNILDDVRNAGGTVNAIVLSVANKRIANGFTGADQVQTTREDRLGGKVLDGYIADGFGAIPFIVDIDFPSDKVAVVNSRYMTKGWKKNDELKFVPFTNTNPREKKELLAGKFGLAVEGVGKTHGLLTAIS